jgi:hypothetical protein
MKPVNHFIWKANSETTRSKSLYRLQGLKPGALASYGRSWIQQLYSPTAARATRDGAFGTDVPAAAAAAVFVLLVEEVGARGVAVQSCI